MSYCRKLLLLLLLAAGAQAQDTITYQGALDAFGQPFSGQVEMIFAVAETEDGPVLETLNGMTVAVVDGLFRVELEFSDGIFAAGARWLEITVDGQTLASRHKITSVPFALNVPEGGGSVWTVSEVGVNYADGNVGIGVETPQRPLHVSGSVITGWRDNTASISGGFVSGGLFGSPNDAAGGFSFVGGGFGNAAESTASFVAGGRDNLAGGDYSLVGAGQENEASGAGSVVIGGSGNRASGINSFVAGGQENLASGNRSFVSGGGLSGENSQGNVAGGLASFVGGGRLNQATTSDAFVGGGFNNHATGSLAFIGGGQLNRANGYQSFIGGGFWNHTDGESAFVAGGYLNRATGDNSFAAGNRARALHDGTFVWSDGLGSTLQSSAENQFLVRATGGAEFQTGASGFKAFSNSPSSANAAVSAESLHPEGIALAARNESTDTTVVINNRGTGRLIRAFNVGAERLRLENNGNLWISGVLSQNSDRSSKEAIKPVDIHDVLDTLAGVEITTWRFVDSAPDVRHIGPMAQDFHSAFGFGSSDTAISSVDAQGVAFAAIQALHAEIRSERARNDRLADELATLRNDAARLLDMFAGSGELEKRLVVLESLLIEGEVIAGR